jgi:hypothetical protein
MKAIGLAIFLSIAVQALPSTLEIQAPQTESLTSIAVDAGSDLQAALNNAKPGDVITLPAGATFTGNFVLPQKTGERFITVRTARSDGLPPGGERIAPTHSPLLAKIESPNGLPALRMAPGAHHWRLMLLEFGPNVGGAGDIISLGDASPAQSGPERTPRSIIIDRCYIHGDPARGQKRGIALNSASTTIIGSHISDIKLAGQETQAIAGWGGPGPFRIENNYLEASGVSVLFGGARPGEHGLIPSDVIFRRNHVRRPPEWKSERWSVKNLFELKNARRVLVEGNLFENNWADAQAGYAIQLTPRGEDGSVPWATVEDVTFRYNILRNTGAAFNLLGEDNAGASGRMRRVKISDNLIYGVDGRVWGGNGLFLQIGNAPEEVIVEHNTVVQAGNIITVYGGTRDSPAVVEGFVFRNNIALHNAFGIIGTGMAMGTPTLTAYFPRATISRNVMAGGREARYSGDNLFPELDRFTQQFVDYAARDYRLRRDSEFRRAATDGADLGVNFVGLFRALGPQAREWLGLTGASDEGR